MMMISRFRIFACLMAALLMAACAPTMVRNVSDEPVVSNKSPLSLDDVRVAITRAGTGLGWVMIEVERSPYGLQHVGALTTDLDLVSDTHGLRDRRIQWGETAVGQ